jgi:hypothetical protein
MVRDVKQVYSSGTLQCFGNWDQKFGLLTSAHKSTKAFSNNHCNFDLEFSTHESERMM